MKRARVFGIIVLVLALALLAVGGSVQARKPGPAYGDVPVYSATAATSGQTVTLRIAHWNVPLRVTEVRQGRTLYLKLDRVWTPGERRGCWPPYQPGCIYLPREWTTTTSPYVVRLAPGMWTIQIHQVTLRVQVRR